MPIYVASKDHHAELWRSLRAAGLDIRASWIDEVDRPSTADDLLSDRRIEEAAEADALIMYHEDTETSTLALLEAGVALAAGKRVYAVGPHLASLGREGHPHWTHCFTLPEAIRSMKLGTR